MSSVSILGKEAKDSHVGNLESEYEGDKLRFLFGKNMRLIFLFLSELSGMSLQVGVTNLFVVEIFVCWESLSCFNV